METFKELADKGNNLKTRLIDFSKAFECIDQDLLIAKLCCYTWNNKHIFFNLKNQIQRTKINDCFSIECGVSTTLFAWGICGLGPLLDRLWYDWLLYECEDRRIEHYVAETAPYFCAYGISTVIYDSRLPRQNFLTVLVEKQQLWNNKKQQHCKNFVRYHLRI